MNDFYVYAYLREKPDEWGTGTPYYIGKGKGRRVYDASRHSVTVPDSKQHIVFIATGLSEAHAFTVEEYLIAHYGRINTKTGCLENKMEGGRGKATRTGQKQSLLERTRRIQSRKASAAKRGFYCSEQALKNMSAAQKGNQHACGAIRSQHTRQQIGGASASRFANKEFKDKWYAARFGGMPSKD